TSQFRWFIMVNGIWISGFSGYLDIANNTFVELMTLYYGIKIAREASYNRLFCYSDSKTVLNLISKDRNLFNCYATTIANIQDM
ncbi:ribonuclease H protein, partial [Trifolium medium]|nr:ribonuclease H protein [Trifolium medium]